jgi:nuclear pore complex protein Nup214
VAFSFPYLFEGILDSILPSGSGPYLLASYLDRWYVHTLFRNLFFFHKISYFLVWIPIIMISVLNRELLLSSNKKNIDQHVVLLKWCYNEDDRRVVSLEFQSDKYTPRIDLQGVQVEYYYLILNLDGNCII